MYSSLHLCSHPEFSNTDTFEFSHKNVTGEINSWFIAKMFRFKGDFFERNNSYYFSRANQQKAGTKIYSLTQFSLTVNECDWHILAGNNERINSHCLTRHRVSLYGGLSVLVRILTQILVLVAIITHCLSLPTS